MHDQRDHRFPSTDKAPDGAGSRMEAAQALVELGRIAWAETLQEAWRLICAQLARWGFSQVNTV
ncbi:MAG: hypothetical protein R3D85_07140 [Paracoccaceae bacterium]